MSKTTAPLYTETAIWPDFGQSGSWCAIGRTEVAPARSTPPNLSSRSTDVISTEDSVPRCNRTVTMCEGLCVLSVGSGDRCSSAEWNDACCILHVATWERAAKGLQLANVATEPQCPPRRYAQTNPHTFRSAPAAKMRLLECGQWFADHPGDRMHD